MKNKVTLQEIAKQCQVSKGLVSRALANKYNVGEETGYKIRSKALELGYDFSKLKVSKSLKKKILILCPSRLFFREDFWSPIIKMISSTLSAHSLNVDYFVYDEDNLTKESLTSIKKTIYQGFVVIHHDPDLIMDVLSKTALPTVVVDPLHMSVDATSIKFSDSDSFYQGTRYLYDIGHRKIAFYGSDSHSSSFFDRHVGYLRCVNDHKDIESLEIIFDNSNKTYEDSNLLKKHIKEFNPTALICANDIIALNAIKSINALGLKVPDDISVIGFDNVDLSKKSHPTLTTFNVPREKIGIEAANYIINAVENRQLKYSQIVVASELIIRDSTKGI